MAVYQSEKSVHTHLFLFLIRPPESHEYPSGSGPVIGHFSTVPLGLVCIGAAAKFTTTKGEETCL